MYSLDDEDILKIFLGFFVQNLGVIQMSYFLNPRKNYNPFLFLSEIRKWEKIRCFSQSWSVMFFLYDDELCLFLYGDAPYNTWKKFSIWRLFMKLLTVGAFEA